MQDAAAVRAAALDAVDDVEPQQLHDRITAHLEDNTLVPGRLTVACASAAAEDPRTDSDEPASTIGDRAAGVQLIYQGLSLTRGLAAAPPWPDGDVETGNVDVLIADILVARGFHLLARTEAADAAVDTVRSFGRDQTVARETDDDTLDTNLERDVFALAAVAGTTAVGDGPSRQLREFVVGLADGTTDPSLPADLSDRLRSITTVEPTGSDGVRTSADY
ncbi:hypothetical protein GJ629_13730 [Halapricum sp. CBA1109]|uniref:DUF7114 family protein n=1 Tax=Halapricum sp. CBA1109 TaxID=2668068 RepID=UPI0012F77CA4|nr:hypothetical protein [Halapricum sp. CBA1109]MUV90830.1 hypothetical protein [Halapricum sp. CBA1109]